MSNFPETQSITETLWILFPVSQYSFVLYYSEPEGDVCGLRSLWFDVLDTVAVIQLTINRLSVELQMLTPMPASITDIPGVFNIQFSVKLLPLRWKHVHAII